MGFHYPNTQKPVSGPWQSVIALIQQMGPALDTSVAWFLQEYHLCHSYPTLKTNPASRTWSMSVVCRWCGFPRIWCPWLAHSETGTMAYQCVTCWGSLKPQSSCSQIGALVYYRFNLSKTPTSGSWPVDLDQCGGTPWVTLVQEPRVRMFSTDLQG